MLQFDLSPDTKDQARLRGFAQEYKQLCKKYNLFINACGCCGSPYLGEMEPTKLGEFLHDIDYISPDNIEPRVLQLIEKNTGKF